MNFILNERSLHGQFESVEDFLKSLSANLKCFGLVCQQAEGKIRKLADFYKCQVTSDIMLGELKQYPRTDELLRMRIAFDKEMKTEPYWDLAPVHNYGIQYWMNGEDVSATALAEAAAREEGLLSFDSKIYKDQKLTIQQNETKHEVISVYHPRYLVECFEKQMGLGRNICLKARYDGTRLDCSVLEESYGADILEKEEYRQLLGTLDKFVRHDSWETIDLDDGLEYKKYTPASEEEDWFRGGEYGDLTIMKFRFSGKMRCFGYRKGERFRLLRIERDHKKSNKG